MGFKAWFRPLSSRFHNRHLLTVFMVCALLTTSACTVLVDYSREQCFSDDDCRARGPAFSGAVCVDSVCRADPAWECLGKVNWPPPPRAQVTITLGIRELVSEAPVPTVTGRICRKLDIECAQPLMSGLKVDASGDLKVPVENGFDGFVEIRAPGYIPGLYFFYPPVDGSKEVPNIPLFSPMVIAGFAQAGQRMLVPNKGHVMLGAYDCQGRPAAGVKLSSEDGDAETSAFYVIKKFPVTNADGTDSSGRAGLINLRPGTVSILGDTAKNERIARVSVLVRANEITYTSLVPAPR